MTERKQTGNAAAVNGREARVRIGPLAGLPALLQDLGGDPGRLIRGAGLDPEQFSDPDAMVPYVQASRLLADCAAATGCETLGLQLGERSPPSSLGLTAFLLKSAPDVGTALRALVRHLSLHDEGGVPVLQMRGKFAALGYAIHQPDTEAADQIYDLSIAIVCNIMRELCGKEWDPIQALLPRAAPKDAGRHKKLIRAPIKFDSLEAAVVFSSAWLDKLVPGADPLLFRYLEREAAERHNRHPRGLINEVHLTLRRLLLTGQCSLANVGKALGMHARTLDRRLRACGTSYRLELEDIRYTMARQILANTRIPLAEIAATLGYGDTTSFTRAFKRWSGSTPSSWRAQNSRKGDRVR